MKRKRWRAGVDTGENMSMQRRPFVVDGVLYLTTDTSTYVINAAA